MVVPFRGTLGSCNDFDWLTNLGINIFPHATNSHRDLGEVILIKDDEEKRMSYIYIQTIHSIFHLNPNSLSLLRCLKWPKAQTETCFFYHMGPMGCCWVHSPRSFVQTGSRHMKLLNRSEHWCSVARLLFACCSGTTLAFPGIYLATNVLLQMWCFCLGLCRLAG